MITDTVQKYNLVFVTGMSGAGKTLALKILAEKGFREIDNLPIHMMYDLIDSDIKNNIDKRALGFGGNITPDTVKGFINILHTLRDRDDISLTLIFLDAKEDVLISRFAATGLTHPYGVGESLESNINIERNYLSDLIELADLHLDTSSINPKQLMTLLSNLLNQETEKPNILITSFGFKYSAPKGADLIFDARLLNNPHWNPALKDMTGQSQDIAKYLEQDQKTHDFLRHIENYVRFAIFDHPQTGKSFYHIAIGCTGGKHRSVYCAEKLRRFFTDNHYYCHLFHKSLSYDDSDYIYKKGAL